MVELLDMRFWAICIAALLIGFTSGAALAVPFFAPSTTVYILEPDLSTLPTKSCTDSTGSDCVTEIEPKSSSTIPLPAPTVQTEFNTAVSFLITESKLFSDGLTVTLTTINDSRCKADMQCIWAGELSPQLTLTGGDFGTEVVSIALETSQSETMTEGSYTLTLGTTTIDTAVIMVKKVSETSATKSTLIKRIDTPKPVTTAVISQPTTTLTEDIASLITAATKKFRTEKSLKPFMTDTALEVSAKKYSTTLRTGSYLAHVDKSGCDLTCRFTESNYSAQAWGENLARMEFEELPTAEYVAHFFMEEWKKSSGHRKNLLSPTFTNQGIGVSVDSDSIYVAVHFALPN
jgi:uncharacterized protein YkwD